MRLAIVAGVVAALCVLAIGTFAVVHFVGEPSEVTSPATPPNQPAVGTAAADGVDAELDPARRDRASDTGSPDDPDRIASLEHAADEGNLDAQYALGITFLSGQWGALGNKHAAVWLQRAAERGHGLAQLQLGRLYRSGVGVQEDHFKAYIWLNLAANQGVSDADMARDAAAALLTKAEVSKARIESLRISERQHRSSVPTQ